MNIQLLIWFILLNVVNVVLQTIRSLATVKCGKVVAALVNALCYGLYTIVVVYTMCDLPLWLKAVIVGLCNLIGVYCVKLLEEKLRKDKLWKVEATFSTFADYELFALSARRTNLPFNVIPAGQYYIVNVYCATQAESLVTKEFLTENNAKYFVSESKVL